MSVARKLVKCARCGRFFMSKDDLREHITRYHKDKVIG